MGERGEELSGIGSNPWLAPHSSGEMRTRSHTLVRQQGQNWVLLLEREGRLTKAEGAEEHVVPQGWGTGPTD